MSTKKPRADSKIDRLPETVLSDLDAWLFDEHARYKDVVARLAEQGIKTSQAALCNWYYKRQAERMREQITQSALACDDIKELLRKQAPELGEAVIGLAAQRAFDLMAGGKADVRDVRGLFDIVIKARQQALDERKISVLEAQARKAQEAEDITKSSLTPEEQAKRIREIFS
jgi:hypothetical protein